MKTLPLFLFAVPALAFAQSPFDGTWILDPPLPENPIEFVLAGGTFHCSGCIVNMDVKADGLDHKVPEADYWDTINVQALDSHAIEIIAKKAGKTMLTEFDAISPDGDTLTQVVKDTTEAQTVTVETMCRRVNKGPADSHLISGTWHAYLIHRSSNGLSITYKCTPEAFSGETPLGEKFNAKFDGRFYPVEDDPGHTMVAAKLLAPNEVLLTHKRKDKIVSTSHLTADPDGKTIHVAFENKDAGTTSKFDFHRQQ
ncbi:MAG TPA: hypothetical protein VKB49_29480 [Candidatus Sulfotelmatobacter sp.]|nr:hypothetical protein [Candidatus Sulfotelmatobacter sp.]